jgi:hypothetical protein
VKADQMAPPGGYDLPAGTTVAGLPLLTVADLAALPAGATVGGDPIVGAADLAAALAILGGVVAQVVQGTTSTSTSIASTSFADTTLEATITLTSAGSSVLVLVSQMAALRRSAVSSAGAIRLLRGSDVLHSDAAFGLESALIGSGTTDLTLTTRWAFSMLDAPGAVGPLVYKTQAAIQATSSTGRIIAQHNSNPSRIVLLEIRA